MGTFPLSWLGPCSHLESVAHQLPLGKFLLRAKVICFCASEHASQGTPGYPAYFASLRPLPCQALTPSPPHLFLAYQSSWLVMFWFTACAVC